MCGTAALLFQGSATSKAPTMEASYGSCWSVQNVSTKHVCKKRKSVCSFDHHHPAFSALRDGQDRGMSHLRTLLGVTCNCRSYRTGLCERTKSKNGSREANGRLDIFLFGYFFSDLAHHSMPRAYCEKRAFSTLIIDIFIH